jgi:hypothetical protein
MAMSVPYRGIDPPYKGNVTETQDTLNAWVERIHRAGIQVNCHANGDVAIDMYLTALERAQKLFPRADARPKITHCTLINDGLVRRIKALGAVPAVFTTYAYYNSDKFPFYGEDLMKRCLAFRTFLDAGVPGRGRLRLFARSVRAADGHSGHGHAHRLGRHDVGRQSTRDGGRSDPHQHGERRVRVRRRGDQGIDRRREAGGFRDARGRPAYRRAGSDQGHPDRPTVTGGTTRYQA